MTINRAQTPDQDTCVLLTAPVQILPQKFLPRRLGTHTHSFNCVILLKTIRPGLNPGPGTIHTCATASRSLSLKYAFNLKNLQSH